MTKHLIFAKTSKVDQYQGGIISMVDKFFEKKSASLTDKPDSGSGIKSENLSNKDLAEKVHKPIIRTFIKEKYTYLI